MIDDGVKSQGVEEEDVRVGDLAMHLLEALENAEPVAVTAAAGGDAAPGAAGASEES